METTATILIAICYVGIIIGFIALLITKKRK